MTCRRRTDVQHLRGAGGADRCSSGPPRCVCCSVLVTSSVLFKCCKGKRVLPFLFCDLNLQDVQKTDDDVLSGTVLHLILIWSQNHALVRFSMKIRSAGFCWVLEGSGESLIRTSSGSEKRLRVRPLYDQRCSLQIKSCQCKKF